MQIGVLRNARPLQCLKCPETLHGVMKCSAAPENAPSACRLSRNAVIQKAEEGEATEAAINEAFNFMKSLAELYCEKGLETD
eukprot:3445285-Alexandrium_andersonii.AAC.1